MTLFESEHWATAFSMADLLNTLWNAIERGGQARHRRLKETGIAEGVLSRFVSSETAFGVEPTGQPADYLGPQIIVRRNRRRPRKGRLDHGA
jgi:hypothetical protein